MDEDIHRDERGWVANPFLTPGFPRQFGHLHMVSVEPGAVRGNHYHGKYREWLFIFGGKYTVIWNDGDILHQRSFTDGEMITVEIPPGTVHAVRNDDDRTIYLAAYQDGNPEQIRNDTFKG